MRPRISARDTFRGTLQSMVAVPVVADSSPESRRAHWYRRLGYDPYGLYGKPRHMGQVRAHEAFADPAVKVIWIRAGKRAGKTTFAVAEGDWIMETGGKVWVFSATQELCAGIFDPLWSFAVDGNGMPVVHKDRGQMTANFRGGGFLKASSWMMGTQGIEVVSCDVALVDEAQRCDWGAFDKIMARTMDTNGKVILIGAEDSSSEFFDEGCEMAGEFEGQGSPGRSDWRFISWSTFDNPHIPTEALLTEQARMAARRGGAEKFAGMYGGERRPNLTAVFPEFKKALHVGKVPFLPDRPVKIWIDPGFNYYAVVPVQLVDESNVGTTVRVFDQIYMSGASDQQVIQETMHRPWWPSVRDAVIDQAAHQHRAEASDRLSTADHWGQWTGLFPRSQWVGIVDGIGRVRQALFDRRVGRPRIMYDESCSDFIEEYRLYKYRLEKGGGERSHSETPIDKWNHHLKALGYGLADELGLVGFDGWEAPQPTQSGTRPADMALNFGYGMDRLRGYYFGE